MRELSKKELRILGNDLNVAKIQVLVKWGFSDEEIANIMTMYTTGVRRIMNKYGIKRESE